MPEHRSDDEPRKRRPGRRNPEDERHRFLRDVAEATGADRWAVLDLVDARESPAAIAAATRQLQALAEMPEPRRRR
ncbi:hypothetical protein F0L68_19140 [Solihabitans fulvus]|uniref:Uncharacterized protein n=1 Tax=Solihabitans fulvus TaxID=1892852 RepID=A0A5B2XCC1_9PSEU|nr:hypothetical protein [Solihabitans fulvus]KAA2260923.1 hypothetical protein F0L68_19140 [Solihabitans fulvus]